MAEVVVNMSAIKSGAKKTAPTPQELQAAGSDFVKQFALIIQSINTPGLTGAGLLKAIQEHQKEQQKPDVGPK